MGEYLNIYSNYSDTINPYCRRVCMAVRSGGSRFESRQLWNSTYCSAYDCMVLNCTVFHYHPLSSQYDLNVIMFKVRKKTKIPYHTCPKSLTSPLFI